MPKKYKNAGNAWSPEERAGLLSLFGSGASLGDISAAHGRTPNAIVGELCRLDVLVRVGRGYRKVSPDQWASFEDLKADFEEAGSGEASKGDCHCRQCLRDRDVRIGGFPAEMGQMIVCGVCGNKRCPHATDHKNPCSGSNEPGQPGSSY